MILGFGYCDSRRVVTESFAGEIDFTSERAASVSNCDSGTIARSVVVEGELAGSDPPPDVT